MEKDSISKIDISGSLSYTLFIIIRDRNFFICSLRIQLYQCIIYLIQFGINADASSVVENIKADLIETELNALCFRYQNN